MTLENPRPQHLPASTERKGESNIHTENSVLFHPSAIGARKIPAEGTDSSPKVVAKEKLNLNAQGKALPFVLGNFYDGRHDFVPTEVQDGKLIYSGNAVDVASLDTEVEGKREAFSATNERVIAAAKKICPEIKTVFSPFNGGETTGLASDYTLATDKLPIGTPRQVEALVTNEIARGKYLLDKLDRGHSYSGVTHEIGYVGAMLQWDITAIQKGQIQEVSYLDHKGQPMNDPESSAAGVRIEYTTKENETRVHEQYSCDASTLPAHVREQLAARKFDGLYLRGTENLVVQQEFFPEYKMYAQGVRTGGVVVSDVRVEDLAWNMEDAFAERRIVPLGNDEQFGYAGKTAKLNSQTSGTTRQGHVNILKKT